MDVQIGKRLKEERDRLGLNQDEFAAIGEAAPRAYWNYEKGKVSPDADFLARLSERGVDVMYVLTGNRVFIAEAKAYQTPALRLAGEISAMKISQEDADLLLSLARRFDKSA